MKVFPRPTPVNLTPLQALAERARTWTPPPKPEALVVAEAKRTAATKARAEIEARCREIYRRHQAANDGGHEAQADRPTWAESKAINEELDAATAAVDRCRSEIEEAAGPWRREVTSALIAETEPVRDVLLGLNADLEAAFEILKNIQHHAAHARAGVPWIVRQCDEALPALLAAKRILDVDGRI